MKSLDKNILFVSSKYIKDPTVHGDKLDIIYIMYGMILQGPDRFVETF